jgi:lipoprotein-releasing system ATP-binding protein
MIKVRNLQKIYHRPSDTLHVLKGVSLTIEAGEVLAIVGPSGAGKSTLLHIMGGLDRPHEGEVLFNESLIYRLNERALARLRNREMGFIFQFYHLLPEFTAMENVMLPSLVEWNEHKMKDVRLRAADLLERVGMKDRREHKPNELSGGEQQRVAIARALINNPKVVFCDEPTGNLDSETGHKIIELLLEFNRQHRQTLVIVTHDEQMAGLSRRVIHMRDGKLVDDDPKS